MNNANLAQDFEDSYISESKITKDYYHKHFITMRCTRCGYDGCQGFAAVNKDDASINSHKILYE